MRRTALYSRADTRVRPEPPAEAQLAVVRPESSWRRFLARRRVPLLVSGLLLSLGLGVLGTHVLGDAPPRLTQADIDRAVRRSLEKKPLPSAAAKAYEVIRPSVVKVVGFDHPDPSPTAANPGKSGKVKPVPPQQKSERDDGDNNVAIGTGVVITEKGAILTNLHVVSGTSRILVIFSDGTESEAVVSGVDIKNDLAVLTAQKLPDDLKPATLVSTGDLKSGDEVLAVGHPFGFGPSVSAGVVSGRDRVFRSEDGSRVMSKLIQFDAAANPGNSGGPLVNMNGEVVGIVTAIFNPVQQRFFVGLGFAVPIESAAMTVGFPPF